MADDDDLGGTPACFLDEVDPTYAGYLTDEELGALIATLLGRVRALRATSGSAAPAAAALAALEATLAGEIARPQFAQQASGLCGFATSTDSARPLREADALASDIADLIAVNLPRIASNVLHGALNRALDALRPLRMRNPTA